VFRQALARDNAVVGMDVDDCALRLVEREMVLDGWKRRNAYLDRRAKTELLDEGAKRLSVLPLDQEVDVGLGGESLCQDPVALPVAIPDIGGVEALEEHGNLRDHL